MRKNIAILLILMLSLSFITVRAEEAAQTAPLQQDLKIDVYVNGEVPLSWTKAVYVNNVIYTPAVATAKLLDIDVNIIEYYSNPVTVLKSGDNCGYFYNDSYYAIINTIGCDMEKPARVINGILYLPCDIFTSLFKIDYTLTQSDGTVRLDFITKAVNPKAKDYEATVNSRNIKSDTDYLIWVSKADYSVRLFKKNGSLWQFENEFPCAIGKTNTPTCEGTYKYYEKITAWNYANYYVGPVMRFNRGYALHSTLIRYDGTAYDDRVEAEISAGCVRMHPSDIQYLWDTVPLSSTVYVTAK